MQTLGDMHRILYGHRWENCEEWAHAVAQLADLSDEEILCVVGNTVGVDSSTE